MQTHTLKNGLTIICDPLPHVDTLALGIWAGVGSRDDPHDQAGMAHALEHMVFKGTTSRSALQIVEQIENLGGQCNAYTGREVSAFYVRMLANDWPVGLEILHDMLCHSRFDEAAWQLEREVIFEEIAQAQDTPDDHVFDLFQDQAFKTHALARPILGTKSQLQAIAPADFHKFLQNHYLPSRLVVVASGKIVPDALIAQCEALFGDIPAGDNCPNHTLVRPQACYHGGKITAELPLQQTHLVLGLFAKDHAMSNDYLHMMILNEILGGGMTSRLFQEIREEKGSAYSIYSYLDTYNDARLLGIYAGTNHPKSVLDDICKIITDMRTNIHESELARAKQQLRASVLMGLESPYGRAEFSARHLLHYAKLPLSEELVQRIDDTSLQDLYDCMNGCHQAPSSLAMLGKCPDLGNIDRALGIG